MGAQKVILRTLTLTLRERETPGGFLTREVQSCEWVLLAGMRRDYRGTRVEAGGAVRDQ